MIVAGLALEKMNDRPDDQRQDGNHRLYVVGHPNTLFAARLLGSLERVINGEFRQERDDRFQLFLRPGTRLFIYT